MDLFDDLPLPKSSNFAALIPSKNWLKSENLFEKKDEDNPVEATLASANATKSATSNNKRELDTDVNDANNSETKTSKKACTTNSEKPSVHAKGYFAERQGERESMQDRHTLIDDFTRLMKKLPADMLVQYFCLHGKFL